MNSRIIRLTFSMATALLHGLAWSQSGEVRQISAVGADPSDMYLQAWNYLSDAEKAAKRQDFMEAVKLAREGELILAAIMRDRPDWKTNMVSFRRQKNKEVLEKWIEQAKEQAANVPPAPSIEKTPEPVPSPNTVSPPQAPPSPAPYLPNFTPQRGNTPNSSRETSYSPSIPIEGGESSYEKLNRELMRAQIENQTLLRALKATREELKEAIIRKVNAQTGEFTYKQQLDNLRIEIERERTTGNELLVNLTRRLSEAEANLRKAEQKNKVVQTELEQLNQRLKETETQLAEVTEERNSLQKERDALKKERDHLAAILELNSPEKTKNLLDRNLTLVAQLKQAQDKIQTLENDKSNNEDQKAVNLKELERTREESAKIKLSLASLMDENVGYRRRISELNNQLTNSEAELSKLAQQPKVDPIVIEENKLLRSTVSKQLRLVSNQIKSRDLMMEAYKRLKLKDPAMESAIQMLGDTSLCKLTPEEQKLADALGEKENNLIIQQNTLRNQINDAKEAEREAKEKLIRKQLESEALGKAAASAFEKGRFAAAEQLYKTLLDEQPDLFPARVNIATILLKRNLVEEAIVHLNKAIQIDQTSSPANYLLGISYYRIGNDKQAISSLLEAVRLQPDNIQAYIYLGNIESWAGHTAQAVEYYNKALAIKPGMPDVLFNKASTLAKAGKREEARKTYDLAVKAGSLPDPDLERDLTTPESSKESPGQATPSEQKPPSSNSGQIKSQPSENPAPQPPQTGEAEKKTDSRTNTNTVTSSNKPDTTSSQKVSPPKEKEAEKQPAGEQTKPEEQEAPKKPQRSRHFRIG